MGEEVNTQSPGHIAASNNHLLELFATFDYRDKTEWMSRNWHISLVIITIYLGVIFLGQGLMRGRTPFNLNKALTFWNFALALFSILATIRTLPELIAILVQPNGFHHSVCSPW